MQPVQSIRLIQPVACLLKLLYMQGGVANRVMLAKVVREIKKCSRLFGRCQAPEFQKQLV